ncbi:MAG: excinuclease ABC subunit UvrC [Clostridiales bacterium]|jgi:excinuclease UvrABC nuclease subunit|nr:excinuclease ABC subunit UvrC [Clostridiales bacterium]
MNLEEKLKNLPALPGVYIMSDAEGVVIYVGKARYLKNRVRQYFHASANKDKKVSAMVGRIFDFRYIVTGNEVEALILESNLIKKYKPQYNILLKDDKAYPFIKINLNEKFPKIEIVRSVKNDGAKYFGPYMAGIGAKDMTELIEGAFPLRNCKIRFDKKKKNRRPCLNYHIKRCLAPCCFEVEAEYQKVLGEVINFLSGNDKRIQKILSDKMNAAGENEEFETAIYYRDKLKLLDKVIRKQIAVLKKDFNLDVFGITGNGMFSVISMIVVRAGKIVGEENFISSDASLSRADALCSFIGQYYSVRSINAREIIVSELPEGSEALEEMLNGIMNGEKKSAGNNEYYGIADYAVGEKFGMANIDVLNAENANGENYDIADTENLNDIANAESENGENYDIADTGAVSGKKFGSTDEESVNDIINKEKVRDVLNAEKVSGENYDIANTENVNDIANAEKVRDVLNAEKISGENYDIADTENINDIINAEKVRDVLNAGIVNGENYDIANAENENDIINAENASGENYDIANAGKRSRGRVKITCPKQGVRKELIAAALKNAAEYMRVNELKAERKNDMTYGAVEMLKNLIGLKKVPHRIEAYDISNIGGQYKVSSMVVFTDGAADNSQYRRFKIKTVEGADDFKSMNETLTRRLERLKENSENKDASFAKKPDLIVIDGGKGQLSSAYCALRNSGAEGIEMISLAKREEEIYTLFSDSPIALEKTNLALNMLMRLRDEAHRFAITYFRKLKAAREFESRLTEIDGIGAAKARNLFKHFKTLEKIKKASEDALSECPGIGKKDAENIIKFFTKST